MSLPSSVTRYLFNRDKAHHRAICFTLDSNYRILDSWGDVKALTDSSCDGVDACEVVPALLGIPLDEPSVLEFVGLPDAGTYDIHIFNEGSEHFVLLLPSDIEEARTKDVQQIANEVRLLNEKQRRLLVELEEARADLEEKRRQAVHASAIKSRFIASMSHEFRTPLTSVIGYAELLLSDSGSDHRSLFHAGAIRRSAHHLLSMVDNILDQARLEDGNVPIRLAPLDIRQVTDDMASMFAPLAAEKLLSFAAFVDRSVPKWLESDEVRLRQILVNLIGNAIKFTDHGEIKLELSWAEDRLVLLITDTGPGIAPDQQERIFDAFHRIGGNDSKRGTGLGLNITARLVAMLDGSVALTSSPGEGSEFAVVIKAPRAEMRELEQSDSTSRAKPVLVDGNARVLLAEDDPDLTELLSLFLAKGGYDILLAGDGGEAIEVALAKNPDLVLMDVNMPVLDGLSATQKLRIEGFDKPVIALTASQSANDREKAFSYGCDGYLVKPISMPELLSSIERYLKEYYATTGQATD